MQLPASALEQLISKPRLDSYKGYWKASPECAVGLYMWNGDVCSKVSKLLSFLEITLRNNIHRELSLSASSGASSSCAWWDPLWIQLKQAARSKINEVKSNALPKVLTADEIVARLSFGFWPNMLSWIAKQRSHLMEKILPGHQLSQAGATPNWRTPSARNLAVSEFFEFKDMRNRIAHHEPLWKFSAVMDTSPIPAIEIASASTDERSSLLRFGRLLGLYDNAIYALSPNLCHYISASSWRKKLGFLLSQRGLNRYKDGSHIVGGAISTKNLHQQFACVVRSNRAIQLMTPAGGGVFIPD
jgi:hypothetical protein